jgi:hypothetical protein
MTVHTKVLEDIEFKAPAAGSSLQKLAITGSIVAAWAAFAWLALGAESIARPVQVNYRDALWMVPFVLTAIAFTSFTQCSAHRQTISKLPASIF